MKRIFTLALFSFILFFTSINANIASAQMYIDGVYVPYFKCPACKNVFSKEADLRKHLEDYEKDKIIIDTITIYECEHCINDFFSSWQKTSHIQLLHPNVIAGSSGILLPTSGKRLLHLKTKKTTRL